jgi:hypothetical protein
MHGSGTTLEDLTPICHPIANVVEKSIASLNGVAWEPGVAAAKPKQAIYSKLAEIARGVGQIFLRHRERCPHSGDPMLGTRTLRPDLD